MGSKQVLQLNQTPVQMPAMVAAAKHNKVQKLSSHSMER
jgi:hypothetical protein